MRRHALTECTYVCLFVRLAYCDQAGLIGVEAATAEWGEHDKTVLLVHNRSIQSLKSQCVQAVQESNKIAAVAEVFFCTSRLLLWTNAGLRCCST